MVPDDLRRIHAKTGVSGVLSLQHDDCLAYWGIDFAAMCQAGAKLGLVMERCPIRDFDVADMRRCLPTAIFKLANLRARGHRVYVHCTASLGRAPLTVLGYLTLVEGYSPNDAIRLILKGRPEAVPAWEAYNGCCEDLVACHWESIERRAYELYELGVNDNASADWYQAQAEVLRSVLTHKIAE
ncbi:MAG: dual specificity protein phosphatase family protein [Desulfobacteraceae bacterium]|nr:dual specificity protein phosphatase family protein [Desulfobacteraceae bacterium]